MLKSVHLPNDLIVDEELAALLNSVADGKITDNDRAREIIKNGWEAFHAMYDKFEGFRAVCQNAERSFLLGWETK